MARSNLGFVVGLIITNRRLVARGVEPWLVLDLLVDDDNPTELRTLQVCDPARPYTVVPMALPRRRYEFMLLPGEETETMLDPAKAAALMRQATPQQRSAIQQLLARSGSGLALAAPGAANGLKQ